MIHNDVLRSIRYILNVPEKKLMELFTLSGGGSVSEAELVAFLKQEDEPGYKPCSDKLMAQFMDGLIIFKRGPAKQPAGPNPAGTLTNNSILKKLRIAFELQDSDISKLLAKSGFSISKTELSALFRKPEHRNYRPCGDQFLRNILKALAS